MSWMKSMSLMFWRMVGSATPDEAYAFARGGLKAFWTCWGVPGAVAIPPTVKVMRYLGLGMAWRR